MLEQVGRSTASSARRRATAVGLAVCAAGVVAGCGQTDFATGVGDTRATLNATSSGFVAPISTYNSIVAAVPATSGSDGSATPTTLRSRLRGFDGLARRGLALPQVAGARSRHNIVGYRRHPTRIGS